MSKIRAREPSLPDERKHKIEELSVGDKIIANVTFKVGGGGHVKFLARIREITRGKGNNILVKSLEPKGPYGEMYINIHHKILRILFSHKNIYY